MFKFNVYPYGLGFAVDIKYTCGSSPELIEETKFNFNWTREEQAISYAQNRFAEWLNEQLKKYVYHADYLFNKSKTGFYMTTKKQASMARLQDFVRKSHLLDHRMLVQKVFTYEQDLVNLLPSSGNPSYESSHAKLVDIIDRCRRYRTKYIWSEMAVS